MNTQTALQRCFDYFVDTNNKPGYRDDNCVYYANGSAPVRCAIGCLIPKRYQVEAGSVDGGLWDLCNEMPALKRVFKDVDGTTLGTMQEHHDAWAAEHIDLEDGERGFLVTRETFLDYLQSLMCFHEGEPA